MGYLSPGVYVEEKSSGIKPMAGVGTATGAFVGLAEKGDIGKAKLITNWSQFVKEFGTFIPNGYLAYAVYSFFAEGGTSCYVVRAAGTGAEKASVKIKDADDKVALTIEARSEGEWGNRLSVTVEDASGPTDPNLFKVMVTYVESANFKEEYEGEGVTEIFDRVSLQDVEGKINDKSAFISVIAGANKKPVNGASDLSGGKDDNTADYIGNTDNKLGLHAFDEIDNINIVAVPDKFGDRATILAGLNYCKDRKDCFFIADPPYGMSVTEVNNFKNATGDTYKGQNALNSSFGALYYPWVYISDPLTGKKKIVPPSGTVAGTYAYTDTSRGVHKAPAGIADGYLDSVVGIETIVTTGEQETLNPSGINVIRSFPGQGICIWGARTLSTDSEWQYVNIRRLLLFIEESLDKGTQWVVFEPNSPILWGSVKRNLTAFLTRVWRDGALFGSTADEAFFVKVDAENNPPEVRDAGQLIIEVGVAPVKPAEFVIIRVSQKTLAK